jgi:protein-tyrosine phosphatase
VKKVSVLMVCRHNICRSPMAAALLRQRLKTAGLDRWVKVDSAATHGDMLGARVDERARTVAIQAGVDIGRSKSRLIKPRDYRKFDHILAMDSANYEALAAQCPEQYRDKLALLLSFAPLGSSPNSLDVPDPYFGSLNGFERVFSLMEAPVDALLNCLERDLGS